MKISNEVMKINIFLQLPSNYNSVVLIGLCLVILLIGFIFLLFGKSKENPVVKRYQLTLKMQMYITARQAKWTSFELSQSQCLQLGFLSGDRNEYYCYNTKVERCGDLIKFKQNTREDSSVNTRYSFLPL